MVETIEICTVIVSVFFMAQYICCLNIRQPLLKAAPLYVIALAFLMAVLLYFGLILRPSGGVAIHRIFAFIVAIGASVALLGDALAWLIWWWRGRSED